MENYTITTSGKACAIAVEKGAVSGIATTPAVPAAPTAPTASAPTPAAAPAPTAVPTGAAGSASVSAPMSDEVVAIKAVVGQAVKEDNVILALETMKTENGIVAPRDGTIASVNASTGNSVEPGAVLATLN